MGFINKPKTITNAPLSVELPPTKMPVVIIGSGSSGTNRYGYSTNLTTWSWGNLSFEPSSLCCGNVNSAPLWVTIGKSGGTFYSSTSTNGTTWTTSSSSINSIFKGWINGLNFGYDMCSNGIFLATGYGGSSGSPSVAISSNGVNWVVGGYPFTTTRFGNNCYYGNGYWVVVGNAGDGTKCVMYSTNISIAGNANITWSITGSIFRDPAYGVVYTGNKWLIGSLEGNISVSSTNDPTSTYAIRSSNATTYPGAIMGTQGSAVVGGAGNNPGNLYYYNPVTTTTPTSAVSATNSPTRTCQIEYVASTTMWIAVMEGTASNNNSIAYSTDAERQTNNTWTNISTVNTNMVKCLGVAAAR